MSPFPEKAPPVKKSKKNIIAAGGIVFRKRRKSPDDDEELEYLLLRHKWGRYWDFPKGRQQWKKDGSRESDIETAKREITEETGLTNFTVLNRLSNVVRYWVKRGSRLIPKEVRLFLVQNLEEAKVQLSHEHIAYKWLSYQDALAKITFDNAKKVLEEAHKRLTGKSGNRLN